MRNGQLGFRRTSQVRNKRVRRWINDQHKGWSVPTNVLPYQENFGLPTIFGYWGVRASVAPASPTGPTVADFNLSTYNVPVSVGNPITTGSVAWQAGDRVIFVGGIEEDGGSIFLNTPTASGLTFGSIATPDQTASRCWGGAWSATAASNGSGAVSATIAGGTFTCGASVYVVRGASGIGNTAITMIGSSLTAALSTTAGSLVIGAQYDYNLKDTSYALSPSSGPTPTKRTDGQSAGDWSWVVGDWRPVAGGSINFGVGSATPTPQFTSVLVELLA